MRLLCSNGVRVWLVWALLTASSVAFSQRIQVIDAGEGGLQALVFEPVHKPTRAVIYSYGAIVERIGYEESARQGYDVMEFGNALKELGFFALIPLRQPQHQGTGSVHSSWRYLISRGFSPENIVLMGFSKGGGITLKAASEISKVSKVVLMSPALGGDYVAAFRRLEGEVLLTLGAQDIKSIRERVSNDLLPVCKQRAAQCHFRSDYPGDHKWFWTVRELFWKDVRDFLSPVSN